MTRTRKLAWSLLVAVTLFTAIEAGLRLTGVALARRGVVTPDGDVTLICAGDSVTHGVPVSAEEAWPAQLAARPEAAGLRVVNFGTPGMRLGLLPRQLRDKVGAFVVGRPVLFVLAGINDCHDLGMAAGAGPGPGPLASLRTVRVLAQLVARVRPPAETEIVEDDVAACRARLGAGLDELSGLAAGEGIPLTIGTYALQNPRRAAGHDVTVNTLLTEEARARGLPVLALSPCVWAAAGGDAAGHFTDGIHLDATGYGLVAGCVAEHLPSILGAPVPIVPRDPTVEGSDYGIKHVPVPERAR